jgi:DNA-binding transcriptional regulator YdaS (Cro superfamily)
MDAVLEKVGGPTELRKSLGISKQTISDWKRWGHVSAKRAPAIERMTGIPAEELAPPNNGRWVRVPDPAWPNPAGRPLFEREEA